MPVRTNKLYNTLPIFWTNSCVYPAPASQYSRSLIASPVYVLLFSLSHWSLCIIILARQYTRIYTIQYNTLYIETEKKNKINIVYRLCGSLKEIFLSKWLYRQQRRRPNARAHVNCSLIYFSHYTENSCTMLRCWILNSYVLKTARVRDRAPKRYKIFSFSFDWLFVVYYLTETDRTNETTINTQWNNKRVFHLVFPRFYFGAPPLSIEFPTKHHSCNYTIG